MPDLEKKDPTPLVTLKKSNTMQPATTLYTQMTEEKAQLFIEKVIISICEDPALKEKVPRIECPVFQSTLKGEGLQQLRNLLEE